MTIVYSQRKRNSSDIDSIVGANLRKIRLSRGVTLEDVAEAVGITYQQLQKYEKGDNRISAGRLVEIADALECHPTDFFANLSDITPGSIFEDFVKVSDFRILHAFNAIACPKQRAIVLRLAETLANPEN